MLPDAKCWPDGLVDYCKGKKWTTKKLYSAFFPDKHIHQPLLLAFLSHQELAPNVDSVFFYMYLDAITPSFESNKMRVFLGKHRGSPVDKYINKHDPLILLAQKVIDKYKEILPESEMGRTYAKQENVSIFRHIDRLHGRFRLKNYDAGTASDWVHDAIKHYAKKKLILQPLAINGTTGENFRPTHAVIDKLKGVNQGLIKKKTQPFSFIDDKQLYRKCCCQCSNSDKAAKLSIIFN